MFLNDMPAGHPVCEQPSCALKQGHMNRPRLADLLIRALSKEGLVDCIPEHTRIAPRKVCVECAQRVIRGRRPLLTTGEREKILADHQPGPSSRTH